MNSSQESVIYFRLNNNGENIQGYVMIEDVKLLMRNKSSGKIQVFSHGIITECSWKLISRATGVRDYIKEHLPEYII